MARNLLLAAASTLLALAICEAALRVFLSRELPRPDAYVLDPDTGKRLRPGWSGDEFGTFVRVSSRGLRNPETPYEKPPGTYRILALGDSWTFGFRMEEEEAWPRVLGRILNERLGARRLAPRVEVINAGVIGYSTYQEAAYFRVEGQRYSPDLVIVAFYPVNDAEDKSSRYERYRRLREIHPLALELYTLPHKLYLRQFWKGARRELKRRAAEVRLAVASRLGLEDARAVATLEGDWTHRYRPGHQGWALAQVGLLDIGETAREIGSAGLVVLLPDVLDLARYEDRYHPRVEPLVRGAVRAAGLDWLDLVGAFREFRGLEDVVRLAGQRHPNAFGYERVAGEVADAVEARYFAESAEGG
jgi:lysophospholipase L1-like esterase